MFVNSCLFKVCFVWILAFWSLFAMFFFSFLFELNWILQQTHKLSFLQRPVLSKKSLLPHVLKKRGFRVLTSPFNRILVAQKRFRTDALSLSSFEMDRSLKHTVRMMIRPLPCWRQHLNLHIKPAVFPLLLSYQHLPLHYKMEQKHFGPEGWIFSQF